MLRNFRLTLLDNSTNLPYTKFYRRFGEGLKTTYLLPISAQSHEALMALSATCRKFLESADNNISLRNLCRRVDLRAHQHRNRAAVLFHSREDLLDQLNALEKGEAPSGISIGTVPDQPAKLAFVYCGQGPQWWGMGRQLYSQEAVYRRVIEECDGVLKQFADWSLIQELEADENTTRLGETQFAQPALFALQAGVTALWRHWGIEPMAVVGHSVGEIAAAYVGGALSLEQALKVAYHRGRIMQRATGFGKMAAVGLSLQEAQEAIKNYPGRLSIAAVNSPKSTVLSGEAMALQELIKPLEGRGVFARLLKVNYAFHSPQMDPFLDDLIKSLVALKPSTPKIPVFSTQKGEESQPGDYDGPYWSREVRGSVLFGAAILKMAEQGFNIFLEIGPHPVLLADIQECLRQYGKKGKAVPSLRRDQDDKTALLSSMGAVYTAGYEVAWDKIFVAEDENRPPEKPAKEHVELDSKEFDALKKVERMNSRLLAAPIEDRRAILETHIAEQLAFTIKKPLSCFDSTAPLDGLGLDSLAALDLRSRLEKSLEIALPATLLWGGYGTIRALAAHLAGKMNIPLETAAKPDGKNKSKEEDPNSPQTLTTLLGGGRLGNVMFKKSNK